MSISVSSVSNAVGARASREEEIAFLIMEDVLEVEIKLADAGGGNRKPDGSWNILDRDQRRGIVEVTSPPDTRLMAKWAKDKREGRRLSEGGSIPIYWNKLDQFCMDLLSEDWAQQNIAKLFDEQADERHLFLFGRSYRVESYFCRLSDEYDDGPIEFIDDIVLPDGLSSVWVEGRAARFDEGKFRVWVAQYASGSGWHRHVVTIDEHKLPPPDPNFGVDRLPPHARSPKIR